MITVLDSGARVASGTAALDRLPNVSLAKAIIFFLDVTAVATDAGDTLDVFVQTLLDGTVYDDVLHFTQVLGNGGPKKFLGTWLRDVTPESELHAPVDAALAAGVLQGPVAWQTPRLKWTVVDAGAANVSFTFSVKAAVIRD